MKKILFVILAALIVFDAFSQSNESRFENRKKEGYYNITQMGLLMGNRKLSEQNSNYYYNNPNRMLVAPSVTMINGIMTADGGGMGIGVGYEIFEHDLFPVFIDIRRTLRDNDVSPFFAFKIGYSIGNLSKKHYDQLYYPNYHNNVYLKNHGGLMINPEMGIKMPLSDKADLLFTVAYRYQKMKTKITSKFGHQEWEYKTNMNRMGFGVAVMFR
jgi:hypothetical protein